MNYDYATTDTGPRNHIGTRKNEIYSLGYFGISFSYLFLNLSRGLVRNLRIRKFYHFTSNMNRVLRAAIEYFWIGGQQMDVLSRTPFSFEAEEDLSISDKELTYWESNIIWSLNQYHSLDKPLVLWDVIAALLAFKEHKSKYVEHIVIKWLSMSFLGSQMDLPPEKFLSHIPSNLSDVPSRLLHLLNIICRRVMLAEPDAVQVNGINSELLNTRGPCFSKVKQIWEEILLSSERELRERLVSFSFSAFLTSKSYAEATPFQPDQWYPAGIAKMKQWVELDGDHARDQLKVLASQVTSEKRCSLLVLTYNVLTCADPFSDMVYFIALFIGLNLYKIGNKVY